MYFGDREFETSAGKQRGLLPSPRYLSMVNNGQGVQKLCSSCSSSKDFTKTVYHPVQKFHKGIWGYECKGRRFVLATGGIYQCYGYSVQNKEQRQKYAKAVKGYMSKWEG